MTAADELIAQGRRARAEHRLDEARQLYGQAAQLLKPSDPLRYAHAIRHIADMFQHEANLAEAKPLYEEALEIYHSDLHTKVLDLANAIRPLALLQERLGEKERARELWREAKSLYSSLRIEDGIRECEKHLANLETA